MSSFDRSMETLTISLASGARVVIRDAEWPVRRVDRISTGGQSVSAIGLSELAKDSEAIFLSEIENNGTGIQVMDPVEIRLTRDYSHHFRGKRLLN